MDLSGLREEYGRGGLDLPDLAADPIEMFHRWLAQAVDAGVHEPNAMVLATASTACASQRWNISIGSAARSGRSSPPRPYSSRSPDRSMTWTLVPGAQ